jgi:hypothetical protein
VVLVYDVSRWGRFQDTDASAYYEYHCRLHGVAVIYVAEAFQAEMTPMAAVIKSLKRAMAAEYSRELGIKTRAGQVRVIELGYATGTLPCIGFRRQSVSAAGIPKRMLATRERKEMPTDRVRWVLGPQREVDLVRKVFSLYADTPISIQGLARTLNADGEVDREGSPFTASKLNRLLHCEKVTGTFVWGVKMNLPNGASTGAPADRHVRKERSLQQLLEIALWRRVQGKLKERTSVIRSPQRLLEDLQQAIFKNPGLTGRDLGSYGCATSLAYDREFGGFSNAMALIGAYDRADVVQAKKDINARGRRIASAFRTDLVALLRAHGHDACHHRLTKRVSVNGTSIGVLLAWQRHTGGQQVSLISTYSKRMDCDVVILLRMHENETARELFVLSQQQLFTRMTGERFDAMHELRAGSAQDLVTRLVEHRAAPC